MGLTELCATEFHHHWKKFFGTTIKKFVTEKTLYINYSPRIFDVLIFIYVSFTNLKIVYPRDIILSYQGGIFKVPISERSLTEYIQFFFQNDFEYSSSGDRSGLYQMVLKLANFMASRRYDLSVQFSRCLAPS